MNWINIGGFWKPCVMTKWDRIRLMFKPLQIKESPDGVIKYKMDGQGRIYIYGIELKGKEE